MTKKRFIPLLIIPIIISIIFLSFLVIAQDYVINIKTIPEDKIVEPNENIQIKIILNDLNNNLINDKVSVVIEDSAGNKIKEKIIQSNKDFEEINIPKETISGEGKIKATYKDSTTSEPIFIGENELVKFEINGEKLIVTNIGNTKYNKKIYITIGDTTGTKTPDLKIGESVSYRLIAPKGIYNIKVTDKKTTLTKGEVQLTGTGNVIGAIDETSGQRSGITGGISPDEKNDIALLSYVKKSKFIYTFILVIFGAMILLAIERNFRRKISQ